ncbi:MAG: hypothetical protein M3320_05190 [Actinomycetota bacterium]|nr:hypothetical protein [Actinomycetota bacterium]MDQ5808053.1 hypothetical protein [Actinomycetota bacterium]
MPRLLPTLMPADLELRLLRKGLGERKDDRDTCSDCGRTPLTGERVHHYANGSVACELCRPAHRGEPTASVLVCHPEHGHTVKVRPLAA